jgi:hypothetical protein
MTAKTSQRIIIGLTIVWGMACYRWIGQTLDGAIAMLIGGAVIAYGVSKSRRKA